MDYGARWYDGGDWEVDSGGSAAADFAAWSPFIHV